LRQPLADLAFVREQSKEIKINNALLAGISFGGSYAYLVFGSCRKEEDKGN
jgi:hypothetical protein